MKILPLSSNQSHVYKMQDRAFGAFRTDNETAKSIATILETYNLALVRDADKNVIFLSDEIATLKTLRRHEGPHYWDTLNRMVTKAKTVTSEKVQKMKRELLYANQDTDRALGVIKKYLAS